jgi:hypothetical protein
MLRAVGLVDQWRKIEASLPAEWTDVRLKLTVADDARCDRAAALLGPLMPGRFGKEIRFFAGRRGAGPGVQAISRLLRRLDAEGIDGALELVGTGAPEAVRAQEPERTVVEAWEAALATLPDDWTDLYCELELRSSDHFERAALLMAPLNPARFGGTPGFRFRVARQFGYGAAPEMARRCLTRLDEARIPGDVRILRALSDTKPVATQGPVWYVGGRSV